MFFIITHYIVTFCFQFSLYPQQNKQIRTATILQQPFSPLLPSGICLPKPPYDLDRSTRSGRNTGLCSLKLRPHSPLNNYNSPPLSLSLLLLPMQITRNRVRLHSRALVNARAARWQFLKWPTTTGDDIRACERRINSAKMRTEPTAKRFYYSVPTYVYKLGGSRMESALRAQYYRICITIVYEYILGRCLR